MPTSKETIENRALDGIELRRIVEDHIKAMLDGDGMFNEYVAYGRVGIETSIILHLDNTSYPEHAILRRTRNNKAAPHIGEPPLPNPSPDSEVFAVKRTVDIDNPNSERIKHGLPLKGRRVNPNTGREEEVEIPYAPDQAGAETDLSDSNMVQEDISKAVKAQWKL
jgi:hypothetical protein